MKEWLKKYVKMIFVITAFFALILWLIIGINEGISQNQKTTQVCAPYRVIKAYQDYNGKSMVLCDGPNNMVQVKEIK